MNKPFFSVIVPTWNRANFIARNISQMLNQDFENFELIVVDDGSTDNTEEVVKQFLGDPRLTYYKKENEERAVARNFGRKKSRGVYVNFFDSDDYAYPNHLSEAYKLIMSNDKPEVFHLNYEFRNGDDKVVDRGQTAVLNINKQLKDGNLLSCNGVFIRSDVASKLPFHEDRDLSASEDYLLWMQLAARYRILSVPKITSCIVDHEFRSVVNVHLDKLIQRKTLMLHYLFEDPICLDYYSGVRSKLTSDAYSYIALHITLADNISNKEAIAFLFRAIKTNPKCVFQKRIWAILKRLILR